MTTFFTLVGCVVVIAACVWAFEKSTRGKTREELDTPLPFWHLIAVLVGFTIFLSAMMTFCATLVNLFMPL